MNSRTTSERSSTGADDHGVWGPLRRGRPRPPWLVPVAALVGGLLVGGVAGYLIHRPGQEPTTRTVVRERVVEVTPEACLRALDLAEGAVGDLQQAGTLIAEFVEAVTSLDFQRAGALIDQARTLGERVQVRTQSVGSAIAECRLQGQPSG